MADASPPAEREREMPNLYWVFTNAYVSGADEQGNPGKGSDWAWRVVQETAEAALASWRARAEAAEAKLKRLSEWGRSE